MNEILKMTIKSALKWTLELSFEFLAITMAKEVASMVGLPEKREDLEKYFKKIFKRELEKINEEFDKNAKRMSKDMEWMSQVFSEDISKRIEKTRKDMIDRHKVADEAAGNDPDKGEGPDNEN